MLWIEIFVCELNMTQVVSRIVPEKQRSQRKNLPWLFVTSKCCLTPSSSEQKTSYLMQYLISNTNMESVSSSKKKKINYRVYIYLTNVKGFFFSCVNPVKAKSFLIYSQHCSFLIVWMDVWIEWPSLVMWTACVQCVCVVCVGWFHYNSTNGNFICELKCLEI